MSMWLINILSTISVVVIAIWIFHSKKKEKLRVEKIEKNLLTNVERAEVLMNEKLVSFSCKPMPNRKINWQNHYVCELPALEEDEPYQIIYNDKKVYKKEVSEEVYQQLIQLGEAFKAYEKELKRELFLKEKKEIQLESLLGKNKWKE